MTTKHSTSSGIIIVGRSQRIESDCVFQLSRDITHQLKNTVRYYYCFESKAGTYSVVTCPIFGLGPWFLRLLHAESGKVPSYERTVWIKDLIRQLTNIAKLSNL